MIFIDEMKNMKIYKRQFFLPYNDADKKHGSLVYLLTPNYTSSKSLMTHPLAVNRKYFESYYMERNAAFYINSNASKKALDEQAALSPVHESYICNGIDFDSFSYYIVSSFSDEEELLGSVDGDANSLVYFDTIPDALRGNKVENGIYSVYTRPIDSKEPVKLGSIEVLVIEYIEYDAIYKWTEVSDVEIADEDIITESVMSDQKYLDDYWKSITGDMSVTLLNEGAMDIITDRYNVVSDDGANNACIRVPGYLKPFRGRSTAMIFKDGKIFARRLPDGEFEFPGGGWEPNENPVDAAIREAKEEARIIVKNPKFAGVYKEYYDQVRDWVKEHVDDPDKWWYGYYSVIFTLDYDSDYTGDVADIDKDIIGTEGQWWDIDEVLPYVPEEYKKAIIHYTKVNSVEEAAGPTVDIPTPEIPDVSRQLKSMVRTLKMRGKHGLYKMNKYARDLTNNLPTADDIMADIKNHQSSSDNNNEEKKPAPQPENTAEAVARLTDDCFVMENCTVLFDEANSEYDPYLKKMIYAERLRTSKDQLLLLKKVKSENPWIKYAFPNNFDRYARRNVFYDLSYYLEIYFKNALQYSKNKRGLGMFEDFMERLLDPKRVPSSYTKKTVFIPISDWDLNNATRMWMYREGVNVVSCLYDMILNDIGRVKKIFKGMDLVFFGNGVYFKINFGTLSPQDEKMLPNKFKNFVKRIRSNEPFAVEDIDDAPDEESTKVIVTNITDKLEKTRKIDFSTQSKLIAKTADPKVTGFAFTGTPIQDAPGWRSAGKQNVAPPESKRRKSTDEKINADDEAKKVSKEIVDKTTVPGTPEEAKADREKDIESIEKKKVKAIDHITRAATKAKNTDDAIALMNDDDSDELKKIILDLEDEEEEISISKTRAARMNQLNDRFLDKEIKGIKVKDLIDPETREKEVNAPLPATTIPVDSPFQDQWSDLQFINFDKKYDVNKDIMKMLQALSTKKYPIAIRDVSIEDTSTSEDYIDTYTIQAEDYRGKRFTIKLDIPKFKDGKYLILRGNKKTIQNQYFNMPILKTDVDTVQVISNYSKIFIRRFGNTTGKTNQDADRLIKALKKYTGKNIKVTLGDNSKIASTFEAPIDYIDIGSVFNTISYKTREGTDVTFYFNKTEYDEMYKDKLAKENTTDMFFYGYASNGHCLHYKFIEGGTTLAGDIAWRLCEDKEFKDIYDNVSVAKKHVYSKASIMSAEVPLVVVCAMNEGLSEVLRKANIEYTLKEKLTTEDRHNIDNDYVKFSDGYLIWHSDYGSSLLLNGLKEIDTVNYSINDINKKSFWIETLDNFGGRLKADGIENFYECMIDPITYEVLQHYKLPTDYVSLLLYGNNLLADNKYIAHGDSCSRRLRRKELIAVKVYKTLFNEAYSTYATGIRHNPNMATFSCKQSAVIDKFMSDPTSSDLSVINCLNDVEASNAVSTKGESGMNSERSYTLDKRTYDTSMLNILGLSTGFANNVGMTRQATINANIDTERGYIKSINGDTSKMDVANSLTMTEALNPMGTTHDDPIRSGMTFIQTAKHQLRTDKSDPLLVTSGADEVMPYVVTDIFCKKANADGKVTELEPNKYMIVQYKDGSSDYIELAERIEKNSDGGFFVGVQLVTDLKVGSTVKANQILAYDNKSFSKGKIGESNKLAYNVGKLAKVAVINSDDNFEDSAMVTSRFAEALATDVIMKQERILSKDTNIYNFVPVGTQVNQEDVLFETQTAYDQEDMNVLLKNLAGDTEQISKLGRRPVKSPTSGVVTGIKLYRTCEIEEMSESLQKLFRNYEKDAKKMAAHLKTLGINDPTILPSIGKLKPVGKLKNCPDSVLIEVYIKYHDIVAVGETTQFISAYPVMGVFSRVNCR